MTPLHGGVMRIGADEGRDETRRERATRRCSMCASMPARSPTIQIVGEEEGRWEGDEVMIVVLDEGSVP